MSVTVNGGAVFNGATTFVREELDPVERVLSLDELAGRIREHHECAEVHARGAKERAREAVVEAWLCGQALRRAKGIVGWGKWLGWLGAHVPGLGERTAQNYMALANTKHVSELEEHQTLTQAYLALGILKRPEAKEREKFVLSADTLGRWATQAACWLRRKVDPSAVLAWPAEEKTRVARELEPLARLYAQLQGKAWDEPA